MPLTQDQESIQDNCRVSNFTSPSCGIGCFESDLPRFGTIAGFHQSNLKALTLRLPASWEDGLRMTLFERKQNSTKISFRFGEAHVDKCKQKWRSRSRWRSSPDTVLGLFCLLLFIAVASFPTSSPLWIFFSTFLPSNRISFIRLLRPRRCIVQVDLNSSWAPLPKVSDLVSYFKPMPRQTAWHTCCTSNSLVSTREGCTSTHHIRRLTTLRRRSCWDSPRFMCRPYHATSAAS